MIIKKLIRKIKNRKLNLEAKEMELYSTYNEEYNRIKDLDICKMSEIMYVNITEPYYYFNIFDPEGNTIEICSNSL